jgi:hypothetical protein
MERFRFQVWLVLATMGLFVSALVLNELLFTKLIFVPGISWVYLPAGVRLLCTLLFAEAGAIGLLFISWLLCFFYFFPEDNLRSLMGGILASAAPYMVYRLAQYSYGIGASLANLTPIRLLTLCFAYSVASPLLHHIWFATQGQPDLARGFLVMFIGDLNGTLLVMYAMKAMLSMTSPRRM